MLSLENGLSKTRIKRLMYTLGQAAKATGRNKATIFQAIKSGRISASKDELGRYRIDPAEVHRLYPVVSNNGENGGKTQRDQTPDNGRETLLLRQIALLEQLVEQVRGERDRLLLLLPKPSEQKPRPGTATVEPAAPKPSLLARLMPTFFGSRGIEPPPKQSGLVGQ